MSGSSNLNSFRDRGQVAVQLVSCGLKHASKRKINIKSAASIIFKNSKIQKKDWKNWKSEEESRPYSVFKIG